MKSNKILDLLEFESKNIESYFNTARLQASTPQEISDFRENYFHDFMSRYFPYPYRITKGQINDIEGRTSCSIDCIVINPEHPHTIDTKNKYSLILADGVDLAIELKPDLSKKNELERGLQQIQSIKKLRRIKSSIIFEGKVVEELLNHSKMIPTFIFTSKVKKDLSKTIIEIAEYYKKNNIPREEQFDFIVINQIGIISNYKLPLPETSILKSKDGKYKACYLYEDWGKMTLARYIHLMNWVYHSTPSINGRILFEYLKHSDIEASYTDISEYFC